MSRRALLKGFAAAPLLLRASPMFGYSLLSGGSEGQGQPAFPFSDVRYSPHYPVRSPLEDVLRLVVPGSDEYVTEKHAYEIGAVLERWSASFREGRLGDLRRWFDPGMEVSSLVPVGETRLGDGAGIACFRREFAGAMTLGFEGRVAEVEAWIGPGMRVEHAEFEITSIAEAGGAPLRVETTVRFSVVLTGAEAVREQRVGTWAMEWVRSGADDAVDAWRLRRWKAEAETRSVARGPGFADVTERALGANPSYREQMLRGADDWRTVLDGACGIDVYGNNGVAAGDFDGDGLDDVYVCQPAGLPNRLYRNRGDGSFEDVTEKAGVGVLDNTACALFADFRNMGRQDLLVVCGGGPLLFLNGGDGTFALKRDAFQFARPPQGTFTHAAIADYDRDGRLDIYFCLYSYYLGLDQYHYPAPYFDARNGPPNFLMQNQGDGTFADRTEAAGLGAENDRYSFSCAWGEAGGNRMPDLYVVNDFGRNNLYRSRGDGTFRAASTEAQVEDVGAGMSACWGDYDNDGRPDLYVANMWSAAGQRVSAQAKFQAGAPERIRELYRRHAGGNALYRNGGNGKFENVSERAGVAMGRWAWGSDFFDFDQDGYPDLYVTNGYITAPDAGGNEGERRVDLGSFFWRQVVGKSPEDATPSLAYEHGWNALNELIRTDSSWSGRERNVMLRNNRDGTFSEVSGTVGMDFLEDGRSFALADLDGDGRLEVVVKNRNAPQLRIVRNAMAEVGDSVAFRLRGTKSNRDAIGAAVTLVSGGLTQTRYLEAGSGFLAQHSKQVFFGLGKGAGAVHATVRWPSGLVQAFAGVPRNSRIELEEGSAAFRATAFSQSAAGFLDSSRAIAPVVEKSSPRAVETWLIDPLKAPGFTLPDIAGDAVKLESTRGRPVLLYFWGATGPGCREQLRAFQQGRGRFASAQMSVVAINIDAAESVAQARAWAERERLSYPVLFAMEEVAGIYNILFRYLYDRRANLAIPTSFLLDGSGMIVKVYQGAVGIERVLEDARLPSPAKAERVRRALPFAGTLHQGEFVRNDFTYGVAMFQHGYLDQAAESFAQVIAARPNDPEAHYNLGTLNLRRKDFAQARQYLQQTLKLKPNYPEAWNNLGMMAAQEGHADEAIRSFKESLQLRPGYATALLNLGNVYRRQQAFAQAQEALLQAWKLQPDDPEASYSLGMLYAQQGQAQPAQEYLEKAIALRPDYPEARNNLGVLLVREQQYPKAEQQFLTCIRLVPEFDQSYVNLARLYAVQHDKVRARAALESLLRVRPDSPAGKQGLAELNALP